MTLEAVCSSHPLKCALVVAIQEKVFNASHGGKDVAFCWVPSHFGISCNETADHFACLGTERPIDTASLPYEDCEWEIWYFITFKCQREWDEQTYNQLHLVKSLLKEWEVRNTGR